MSPELSMWIAAALLAMMVLVAGSSPAHAERLPITAYGAADGLPSTFIGRVAHDSRGFVWFSTRDGLSRFDGLRFVNYGVEHGLPNPTINFLLETRTGDYWVATNGGGVCRMHPVAVALAPASAHAGTGRAAGSLFTCYKIGKARSSDQINTLYEDARGRVWIGSDDGLFRIDEPRGTVRLQAVPLDLPQRLPEGIHTILEDAQGVMWIGLGWGLMRIAPDGGRTHFTIEPTPAGDNAYALLFDRDGRLWIGHQTGLIVTWPAASAPSTRTGPSPSQPLVPASAARALPIETPARLPAAPGESAWYLTHDGRFEVLVQTLHATADDHIWLGTTTGLIEFDRQRFRRFTTAEGLSDIDTRSLATDREGNLWMATTAGGAMKLTRNGFRSYDRREGLGDERIQAIFEDRAGVLHAVSGDWTINRFDGARFTHAQPSPHVLSDAHHAWNSQVAFLDRTDRWWLLTTKHLSRLPPGAAPAHVAAAPAEIVRAGVDPNRMYEDRHGDVWIGLRYTALPTLLTWRRATNRLDAWTEAHGMPPIVPNAFAEDDAGHLWIGLIDGDFLRFANGRFTRFAAPRGPGGAITSLCRDDEGRLWAGSNRDGVIRIDAADSAQPRFTIYSKAEGLGSSNVRSIVADRWGRIYAGTARGVDRVDPDTGRVQHYTTGDGLLTGFVNVAYRDRMGALWFGSLKGLSRLTPEPLERREPPPVFIGGVRAGGAAHVMSHLGQIDVTGVTLRPGESQLQIEFFGLSFGMGESLRYQYRLDGADPRDAWSEATSERTVHYSRLPPRGYRFQVRAMRTDGTPSARAATVSFDVLPALWQRAWFQALVAAAIALLAYAAYRVRVARLLALERVRSRIAGDLHDDIGATLAQIAVLSEVVQTQIDETHAPLRAPLARIAQTAREAIASMSDIVWAINPQKDSLHEMVRRMRRFANEVLPARGIAFRITAPDADARLGADVRRHVYLIFKEALNNILRHAECNDVEITLRLTQRRLHLSIVDNGRGFALTAESDGHGLTSMARRAQALGGALDVESGNGRRGTAVTASIPLGRAA